MHARHLRVLALVAASVVRVAAADAQSRAAGAQGRPSPAPTAAPAPTSTSSTLVSVTALQLRRDTVLAVADQLKRSTPGGGGWTRGLGTAFTGDHNKIDAAKRVLGSMAQRLDTDGHTTVVVVIGNEDDRDKVVASLAQVQRPVRVAFVARDFADATTDNTALNGGLAGRVTDAASNVWVYLPRRGAPLRERPSRVLSAKVVSPSVWNGLFAADGDTFDVGQLRSLVHRDSGESLRDSAPAASDAAPAVGDVVLPRIAGAKLFAEASTSSKALGTVAATDELVVVGAMKDGFVRVDGASASGWIRASLLTRKGGVRR